MVLILDDVLVKSRDYKLERIQFIADLHNAIVGFVDTKDKKATIHYTETNRAEIEILLDDNWLAWFIGVDADKLKCDYLKREINIIL